MKLVSKRVFAALSVAAVSVVGLSSAQAADDSDVISQSDFSTVPNETAAVGGFNADFVQDGIRLVVQNPDDGAYAIGVFPTSVLLKSVHTVTYAWAGSDAKPGIKLDVDVDGDGSWDCQLVNESVYGDRDLYLNKDTEDSPLSTLPAGYCTDAAPKSTGATGNATHGSVDAWSDSLGAGATVVKTGYGASGIKQDGTLSSISLGDRTFTFSDENATTPTTPTNPTPTDTTGTFENSANSKNLFQLTFTSDALTSDESQGAKITWQVKVGDAGKTPTGRLNLQQGAGESSVFTQRFVAGQPKQTIQVIKNGVVVKTYSFTPSR